jgi:hypothetical protein
MDARLEASRAWQLESSAENPHLVLSYRFQPTHLHSFAPSVKSLEEPENWRIRAINPKLGASRALLPVPSLPRLTD